MLDKQMLNDIDEMDFEDMFDCNFSVNEEHINTMEDLHAQLINPYKEGKQVCYRGERVDSLSRPLLPTLFRNRDVLIPEGKHFVDVDADFLLKFYGGNGRYMELFNQVFGRADRYHMYDICAFSQHYMNCSPLIDLTKSPYVALSFALKGKKETEDDAIVYTVEVPNSDNYTNDPIVAECWMREYHVSIYNKKVDDEGRKIQCTSPSAKIIDIATNDLMKYQQGMFLLLTDFSLVNKIYRTKKIRTDINIVKHIIKKELCGEITDMIRKDVPWYDFEMLMNISGGIRKALEARYHEPAGNIIL